MSSTQRRRVVALLAIACVTSVGVAGAAPFHDVLVQSPTIGTPQRGSLAGTLSKLAFGPGDLVRGTFGLPLPISAPSDRGPLLAKVIPSYSPETGITEWGMGWQADLKIQRFQPRGEVDFVSDELTSPWGQLVQADDGSYYPRGLATVVRVTPASGGWIAQSSDGTRYRFDATDSVTTAQGVFAWMLSRVDTVLGDSTTLNWIRNDSGRPFLSSVHWGGRWDGTQYELAFTYAPTAHAFVSYISGARHVLDRRISEVAVKVKQGASYAVRWRYDLAYITSSPAPAYYLQQITRAYASGAADPPVTYDYDLNVELWSSTQLAHTPGLDAFIAASGSIAIQPDRSTLTDLEQNGLLDLETSFDQTTVRQTDTGFTMESLPPATGPVDSLCRPSPSPFNKPRVLARMHGDAMEPHVVVLRKIGFGATTRVLICDRLGAPLLDQSVNGNWELGATTRLADIDLDQRPDVVRVRNGEVAVLYNTSTGPDALSVAAGAVTALSPRVTPVASWLHDLNGDGRADLMVRHAGGVHVWFGIGHGAFDPAGQGFAFITSLGTPLAGLGNYQFSHGDYNGDGASDLLLTQGQTVLVFVNTGTAFVQAAVPGLVGIPWTVTFPVIADLAGTGNESAMFVNGGQAMAIQLTSSSTGLLRAANDGKGTIVRFGYGRARPAPGIVRRYATLTSLTIESSGYDPVTHHYEYSDPALHSLGKYLVGFGSVEKRSPAVTENVTFHNDDDISGVQTSSEDIDVRSPGIVRFIQRQFDDVRFRNVRWLRPSSIEAGHRTPDGLVSLSTTTHYTTYERELCPTVTVRTGPSGQLVTTTALSTIPPIPDDLNCLPSSQNLAGTHTDASLDFGYLVELTRNDLGQITRITQYGASLDLQVLQEIDYDADHRITSITTPGRGQATTSYDTLGRLTTLTDPVGVVTRADSIDPVSDALLELQTERPNAITTAFFEYDSKERLRATWDDVSGAGPERPLQRYGYQDVTTSSPGRVDTETLSDALTGVSQRTVDLIAADGEVLASARWLGSNYAVGTSTIEVRGTLTSRRSFIGTMTGDGFAALTSADLRALGTPLTETVRAGFGHASTTTTTYQAGVSGTVTQELVLGSDELITRVYKPGGIVSELAMDAAGKLVRRTDENGVMHRYTYDALGRLVQAATPDGAHTLRFDGFGRPARISREGIGAITYEYDPVSGLPVRKQRLDAAGTVIETTDTEYDGIGRQRQLLQSGSTGTSSFSFDYDGQLDSATVGGQLGRLSRVRGDGWERTELFDPLGRPFEQRVVLNGWREVTCDKAYRADGSVASDTVTITDSGEAVKLRSTKETTLDDLGRVSALKVNGNVLYTLSYDGEGRLARAYFSSGETFAFDFDPVTHQRRGHRLTATSVSGGVHWERDARGLIAAETYATGSTTTRREYLYDGRGALVRATAGDQVTSYTYTASGLPESITDIAGSRTIDRTSSTMTVGGVVYTWDAAGRVTEKDDWTLSYGPNGQVTHANRPGRQIEFIHDEGSRRLLKRVDGVPVRSEIAGGVLTEDRFIEPIEIGGVVVGVLDNGEFTALLTDQRGTPFAGPDGTPGLTTPYGVRASHLDFAEVIDYARLGWDPDLDVVRMGVRDYDARLGQFLTPDPLYFESLEKCQDSPLQCSLYGYAGGNPISFIDPTGLGILSWLEENMPHVVGALKVAAGFVIAAGGVAACTTGAGCVLGGLGIAYGASLAGSGAADLIGGTTTHHQVNTAIAAATSQQTADNFDVALGAAMTGWALSGSPSFVPLLAPRAQPGPAPQAQLPAPAPKTVTLDGNRYPQAAQHIDDAQAAGRPATLTIHRAGTDGRRAASMQGHPRVPGLDRDEYPPAMFLEGGAGASVRPISRADNRGAGACVGNQCRGLPDGSQVTIKVIR